jgi:hypothetical protein
MSDLCALASTMKPTTSYSGIRVNMSAHSTSFFQILVKKFKNLSVTKFDELKQTKIEIFWRINPGSGETPRQEVRKI